jgi:5-formyltetrahydrofolate cyclo-ligase
MPDPSHGFIPSSSEDLLRRRVKAELRKRMRGLRAALPAAACAERSARIVGRLRETEPVAQARSVALFWPIAERHEVDLRLLDAALRDRGVQVAYPALVENDQTMTFRFVSTVATMQAHPLGFLEPPASAPQADPDALDVIVVPALAVDPRGHRIGYGAGHYDRWLSRARQTGVSIAVAFDFQLVAEVPETAEDIRVTWIVTDARTLLAEP